MSESPAGWFNDPYGRYEQRYWDGTQWTGEVATGGVRAIDPMGASPVIPVATPASAFAPPDAPSAAAATNASPESAVDRFIGSLGEPARERPPARLRATLGGLGGASLAVGVLAALTGDDPSRGLVAAVAAAIAVAAIVVRLFVHVDELRAAAVGMFVVAAPVLGVAATVDDGSSTFLTGLVVAVLLVAAWAAPGFRGTNLFLAIGLLALLAAFGSLSSPDTSDLDRCNQFLEDGDFDSFDEQCQGVFDEEGGGGFTLLPTEVTGTVGDQGAIYLVGAALLLGATWALDRRRLHGTATAFAVAGLIGALVGTGLILVQLEGSAASLFVAAVGLVVCAVGSHGARRATTWWGAALVASGVISFLAIQIGSDSASGAGAVGIVAGVALVAMALLARLMRERVSAGSDAPR